ncbi:MAG: hypothetical protein CMI53_03140 [Parcubacteria group bacterium]|nr:hypothetical protein [Parcubacteria group bacterium]|tara:strand:+ start:11051 stop:12622 length:1572 start_codon:yes stop_codon:yes gene_type:complete
MVKKQIFILVFLSILMGGVYFWLVTPGRTEANVSHRFDWPDETTNYFWSVNYAQTGQLIIDEPLNIIAKNQIHPRSFNVRDDGALVPGSFLGLILFYGTLAKIFSTKAIIYFTPILSILGVLAFYGIIRRIFNNQIAFLAAILMLAHPAWWYYSVTSMLPNVAFVSLILVAIYFLFRGNKLSLSQILISGLLTGLAVAIRPAEIIWLMATYASIFVYLRSKISFTKIILFLAVAVIVFSPAIYQQKSIYGNFLTSGYSQLDAGSESICHSCQIAKSLILPFGFHPTTAVLNFWNHYLSNLWWLSLLAILGLVAFLTQTGKQKIEIFGYMGISLFIFGWLIIYYGSWLFTDLLTVHLNTLGLSYVRYWLPLYLLALPFVAIGLIFLTNFVKRRFRNIVLFLLLVFLFYSSANLVLQKKPDSILPVRNRIVSYKENASKVIELTEPEAVIVTVRKDKLFFPDRRVIHSFEALSRNDSLIDLLPGLLEAVPVYYYALAPESTLDLERGLQLELVTNVGQELLYKIK